MKQLFLTPNFHIETLSKGRKSASQKLKEWHQTLKDQHLTSLALLLGSYVPQALFDNPEIKQRTRRRIFTVENTFWAFLTQTLQDDSSCQSIVHQLKAVSENVKAKPLSSSTSAYCQARKKLPQQLLDDVFEHTQRIEGHRVHPLINRRVVCADGTGLLALDTPENQARWPQPLSQAKGCGFPQLNVCGLFNLHTGLALSYRFGNKHAHELPLLREQGSAFARGDVFIGDKGFYCYYDQARLLNLGVDTVVALSRRQPTSRQNAQQVLGEGDLLISVPKPKNSEGTKRYPQDQWNAVPDTLTMRQIHVTFNVPGYRSESVYLHTTLIDHEAYPAEVIAELYRQRWLIELFFRDLKTTLGMEMIKAKTPEMVCKSLQMYMIAYNLIRCLMCNADTDNTPTRLSLKGCIQTVIAFCQLSKFKRSNSVQLLLKQMYQQMRETRLPDRARMCEPRVLKQRRKPFSLMRKSRDKLKSEMYRKAAQIHLT